MAETQSNYETMKTEEARMQGIYSKKYWLVVQ